MTTTRHILAGNLIDGSGAASRRQVFLSVENGIITAVGPVTELPRAADTPIDDLSHCTIVPPLVDCSVALASSAAVATRKHTEEQNDNKATMRLIDRHLADSHNHGVLGLADHSDQAVLRPHAAAGSGSRFPVIVRSARQCLGSDGFATDSCQHDFLRIASCADIEAMDPFAIRVEAAELCRLLAQPGDGKKVVVANGPQAVAEALDAGCDAIEQGYAMGEENLRAMAERQVLWIPSLLRAKNGLDGSASGGDVCCRFSLRFVAPGKRSPAPRPTGNPCLRGSWHNCDWPVP